MRMMILKVPQDAEECYHSLLSMPKSLANTSCFFSYSLAAPRSRREADYEKLNIPSRRSYNGGKHGEALQCTLQHARNEEGSSIEGSSILQKRTFLNLDPVLELHQRFQSRYMLGRYFLRSSGGLGNHAALMEPSWHNMHSGCSFLTIVDALIWNMLKRFFFQCEGQVGDYRQSSERAVCLQRAAH